MYAIKIISGSTTYLYQAEEISYSAIMCKDGEEFFSNMDNGDHVFIIGEVPKKEFEYYRMHLNDSFERNEYKLFYIMPTAWIYIMQSGKTIEALQLHELQHDVEI